MKYIQNESANRADQSPSSFAAKGTMRVIGKMLGFLKPSKPVDQPVKTVVKAREVTCAEYSSIQLQPDQAVYFQPTEVFTLPSSRVITVTIEGAKGVPVGRIWLYLYRSERKVRRVFRIEDEQIRAILGTKSRYYMTDLQWKVDGGDAELSRIRHQSASDVERLIVVTHNERMSKKPGGRTRSEFQGQMKIAPEAHVTKNAHPAPAQAPVAQPTAPAPTPEPAPAPVSQPNAPDATVVPAMLVHAAEPPATPVKSVARPVAGRSYTGVISEMGQTTRQGQEGSYKAFCVKLESDGVHMPLYGVELEREIIERKAVPGDLVKIVLMHRQPIEGSTKWKNLYKVEILSKGAK